MDPKPQWVSVISTELNNLPMAYYYSSDTVQNSFTWTVTGRPRISNVPNRVSNQIVLGFLLTIMLIKLSISCEYSSHPFNSWDCKMFYSSFDHERNSIRNPTFVYNSGMDDLPDHCWLIMLGQRRSHVGSYSENETRISLIIPYS